MPGIDIDALGPFSNALTGILVLIATVFVAIAVIRLILGVGKATVASGGDKGKVKEGWAQARSSAIFIVIILGLPFFIGVLVSTARWVFN